MIKSLTLTTVFRGSLTLTSGLAATTDTPLRPLTGAELGKGRSNMSAWSIKCRPRRGSELPGLVALVMVARRGAGVGIGRGGMGMVMVMLLLYADNGDRCWLRWDDQDEIFKTGC